MDDVNQSSPPLNADLLSHLGLDHPRHIRVHAWHVVASLLLLGGVAVFLLAHGSGAVTYMTQPVRQGSLEVTASATGTLAPRDQVDVGAETSGRIDAVFVDFNDAVKKGQTLAQINTDQLQAQLRQARASQAQASATVNQAERALVRTRRLAAEQALSEQALDAAVADRDRARASVALAEAQIDQLKTALGKTTIRAPIDGVVLDRKIEPGQTVVASLQTPVLFTLASDLSRMELNVDIDEADLGQIKTGQNATFKVDAYPTQQFEARLVSVHSSPKTVNGVVTYLGVLWLDNPKGLLKPGMTATAEIETALIDDGPLIPNSALRYSPSAEVLKRASQPLAGVNGIERARIWVLVNGAPQPRDIVLGASDGTETQIVGDDLQLGENVIVGSGDGTSTGTALPSASNAIRSASRPGGRPPGGGPKS